MELGEGERGLCGGLRALLALLLTDSSLSLGTGPFLEPAERYLVDERDKQEAELDLLGMASQGGKGTDLGFPASSLQVLCGFLLPGGGPQRKFVAQPSLYLKCTLPA